MFSFVLLNFKVINSGFVHVGFRGLYLSPDKKSLCNMFCGLPGVLCLQSDLYNFGYQWTLKYQNNLRHIEIKGQCDITNLRCEMPYHGLPINECPIHE